MEIFYLRDNELGTGQAHRDIDTGLVVPPNGHRLVALKTMDNLGSAVCAVKIGDDRYTYFTPDGMEAVDTDKIKKVSDKAADMAGWADAKRAWGNLGKTNAEKRQG